MTFRNVLVAYNGGPGSRAALEFAIWLVNHHDAHLTGILAHGASQFTQKIPAWLTRSLKSSLTDIVEDRIAELTQSFRDATAGKVPADRLHWLDVREEPDQAVARFARLYDLTIVGQYENLLGADELVLHPDRIAYASGRPTLLIPRDMDMTRVETDTAVVAWDGGRRAARAFFDAMPILQKRKRVILATVDQGRDRETLMSKDNLERILGRHNLNLEHCTLPASGSTAATLLRLCQEEGAAPLIMGAYEHARWSEDLMGGVTQEMAQTLTVPILMSH
ncbi:MAG: universal stress protein [Pelagimonas sp.]|jgi:nucleotide-binding universal stress UspA family protein|nr:universal stress protein [Pelagimonas sp.]